MNQYRADLHMHTVLSPCGDLDMSPVNLVSQAASCGLDIIAITDHNSTLHGPLVRQLAQSKGIMVVYGAEVTTKEEAHCVCLFDTEAQRLTFQHYLEAHLPNIPNNPDVFGYQVEVNENDEILQEIEPLLISSLDVGVNQIEAYVHQLGGLFIPAHVDKTKYSLISQLGFVPFDLQYDALELSQHTTVDAFKAKNGYLKDARFIRSSDAHMLNQIGTAYTTLQMEHRTFDELRKALNGIDGRDIIQ
ncbi:MAG: PHP domain-containing protein [Bacteroidales bacterium]|nr:PHP domain-containing protein [Bacteroidales bacterium]MBN2749012.1 PHP domain-containing protein [Bacteroidales bacterium]